MKIFEFFIEMILLICMIAVVQAKEDIRLVIEVGVLYLATIIRITLSNYNR